MVLPLMDTSTRQARPSGNPPNNSPEDCFVQTSSELDLIELIVLGFEFCGSYALSPGSTFGFVRREPHSTVPKLLAAVENAAGRRGAKQARRSLKYIMPNSASPGETGMAMLLSMPHLLGGFKLEGSQLNVRLDLGKRARSMFGKRYFVFDMCWPEQRLAVEYDSDLFNTGSEPIANDSKRRNALLFMGYTEVTITRKQIYNFSELDKAARR